MTASLRRGIDEMLAEARARLDRLDAREAHDALRAGAVPVDIRPQINRDLEGGLPGAVVMERNVLEWRLDPASGAPATDLVGGYRVWRAGGLLTTNPSNPSTRDAPGPRSKSRPA